MENIENTENTEITIFDKLLKIFENDSKVLSILNNSKNRGNSDKEILLRALKARPRNVKVKQLITDENIQLNDIVIEPVKRRPSSGIIPKIPITKAEVKRREEIKVQDATNDILKNEELKNRMIQEYLDRNNFKEIPKFEGSRPLNREGVIIKSRIDGIKEEEKKKRLLEWEELNESEIGNGYSIGF